MTCGCFLLESLYKLIVSCLLCRIYRSALIGAKVICPVCCCCFVSGWGMDCASVSFLFYPVWIHLCLSLCGTRPISLCLFSPFLFLSLCLSPSLSPSPAVVTYPGKALLAPECSVQIFWAVFQIQAHLETS